MFFSIMVAMAAPAADVLKTSCNQLLPSEDESRTCIARLEGRPEALDEVAACGLLSGPHHRLECVEVVPRATVAPAAMIRGCVEVFGDGIEAMRCVNALSDTGSDPTNDLKACGKHLEGAEARLACVQRFRSVSWDAEPIVEACAAFDDSEKCLANYVGSSLGRGEQKPVELIASCKGSYVDQAASLKCLNAPHGAAVVLACARLDGEALRAECNQRGGEGKTDVGAVLNACIDALGTGKDALRCFSAVSDALTPPQDDIRACAVLQEPKQRIACAGRFKDIGWNAEPAIEGCKLYPDPVACLAAIGQGGNDAPSFLGLESCRKLFADDGAAATKCVRGSRKATEGFVSQAERCQSAGDPEARLTCMFP